MKNSIGFTGTQRGLTAAQKDRLRARLEVRRAQGFTRLHAGDCVGADWQAATIANLLHYDVISHPPSIPDKRAFFDCYAEERPEKPYLERNRNIVRESAELIACPKERREVLRSGTWATVRFARRTKKPVTVFYPDGSTEAM
jgi:hypothetical protein